MLGAQQKRDTNFFVSLLVLKTGIEPVRYRYRRILSPVRLPVPPLQRIYLLPSPDDKINYI
jgi:hypothetical protein